MYGWWGFQLPADTSGIVHGSVIAEGEVALVGLPTWLDH